MRYGGEKWRAIWWDAENRAPCWIDQRQLPQRFELVRTRDPEQLACAIETMQLRGAPTIGAAAAFGLALAWQVDRARFFGHWLPRFERTRPTAVNLFKACDAMRAAASVGSEDAVLDAACAWADAEVAANRAMGEHLAARLARGKRRILTHCNAGWLAAVDWGTATSGIYALHRAGERPFVWVDETRPLLQGARLTAWEMVQEGVACRIQVDGAAAWRMACGEVDAVVVGADRIAANGDVANKIGTHALALAARAHGVPFFVAAPSSTFDAACPDGGRIPIERRDESEVIEIDGKRVAADAPADNPAFDVTPFSWITAIVTECGEWRPDPALA